MDNNMEVMNLSNQLAQAVEAALNPEMPQDKRHEAYNACEEFKEKSPLCIQCSMYLSVNGSDIVRHYGLQLMEYCVKYKWYEIDQSQKVSIKDVTMSLLQSCEGDITQHLHLRDALSRVIVEMMKREWPQHWPNLLPELYEIASKGHIQAEIILLIFLRFIEDIVVLQTLEYAQRRRDLYQHLMLQLEDVIVFLLNLMAQHYKNNVSESIRIINISLKLLSEIVEFAFINRLVTEEKRIIPILCNLLTNEHFQIETVECLNRIANKKGKHEDKRIICKLLFGSNLIGIISQLNLMLQNGSLNERNYLFIKKVSELLSSLCCILSVVVKNEYDNICEFISLENFTILLEILINLCNHPSFVVAFHINTCWTSFFKHSIFNKNSTVLNYISKWVSNVTPKIIKIPYVAQGNILLFQECYKYLIYDFDSEEAFSTFYYRFRVELLEAFRHLTNIAPVVTFNCAEQWLLTRIQKSSVNTNTFYSPFSQDYLEWEALGVILDTIINNLPNVHDIPLECSFRLLDLCFALKHADPQILSLLLSCISPLLYFLNKAPLEMRSLYVPRMLETLFSYLVFEMPGESKFNRSKNVRELRKHAACSLVKSTQKYPLLFLPFFNNINKVFKDLKAGGDRLNKMELVLFLESMLLINNAFCEYDRQSRFICDIFEEIKDYWMKMNMDVFNDYSKFLEFIGLDAKALSNDQNLYIKNRSELMYCIEVIAAIVKRSIWPESKEAALKGGFLVNTTSSESEQIYRNPCTPHILPALPGVFSLIKIIHSLWTDEVKRKLPTEYEKVHELSEVELKMLFGAHISKKSDDMIEIPTTSDKLIKLQTFFTGLYESCFTILTKACYNLRHDFYDLPNFAPSFAASVFFGLNSIPDYRLRVMVKLFLKPFIYSCPIDKYDSILLPILGYFSTYILEKFSNKWKYLNECRNCGKLNDDSVENSQELIEDFLNTQLSREYMDVVKSMLLKLNIADLKQCNGKCVIKNIKIILFYSLFIEKRINICIS